MFRSPLPWILVASSLVLTGCHTATLRPEQPAPSEAFGQYQRLNSEAKDLLEQAKRDLAAQAVEKTAAGIEHKLVELEPGVNALARNERPHARRLVDQTLSLLDAIRDQLAQRQQPAP